MKYLDNIISRNLRTMLITGGIVLAGLCGFSGRADELVILHTNDTHSLIEPDANGAGGVLQRKAIIDSVRRAEKNVILVDAGDMVQGTLFQILPWGCGVSAGQHDRL
ncbi:MAG: hypothetical protein K2M03_01855 [Muribaculaceae bacterium]|nr:hypothetical protein [Muribaculaceae bacterium]